MTFGPSSWMGVLALPVLAFAFQAAARTASCVNIKDSFYAQFPINSNITFALAGGWPVDAKRASTLPA